MLPAALTSDAPLPARGPSHAMRSQSRRSRVQAALIAGACLLARSPHAAATPAPLPDWDTAKPGTKPGTAAPLPDWDAAKPGKKPAKKPAKKSASKPAESEPTQESPDEATEPSTETTETTEPAEPITTPEPTTVEAPAPAPTPVAAPTPPKPDPAKLEQARRTARAELIVGAVMTAGGLAGAGVLAGGIFVKRSADKEIEDGEGMSEEMLAPLVKQQKQGETLIAAGAISGAIGLAVGIALLAAGARDLKATRQPKTAHIRVAPSFGGLVVFGRF